MSILERVKDLCKEKGMTVAELERKANLGNGSIRRWEDSVPAADKLQRTAKILGTTMSYLLNGTEEPELDHRSIVIARKISNLSDADLEFINIMIDRLHESED